MKIIKGLFGFVLSLLLIAIGFGGGFVYYVFVEDAPVSETLEENVPGGETGGDGGETGIDDEVIKNGDLSIHFMELGNIYTGDSILIQCGDNDILIDAGSEYSSAPTLISYIDKYVTDNTLEYVIATHGHTDHIAAFCSTADYTGIFEHYKVENIIDFPLTNSSGSSRTIVGRYRAARDNEIAEGANHWTALECYNEENGASRVIQLSEDVNMEILYSYYYENTSSSENNYSVCLMINQGDNHYLFTGDLETAGEKRLVTYYEENHGGLPHCVLYKAGHHGSKTSSCPELMEAITPEYVVVCCCAGTSEYTDENDNLSPTQEFIDNVAPYTKNVYVTTMVDSYTPKDEFESGTTVKSMNGNIVFTVTDGQIKLMFSNNNLRLLDTEWFKSKRTCPEAWL